jgi:RimJ/RimL family protein N-acetyltransferase
LQPVPSPAEPLRLEPWSDADRPLLDRINAPEMTRYLGGPESPEKVEARFRRYVAARTPKERAFKVVRAADGVPVGSIAYWDSEWKGAPQYETGWAVLPQFQGLGHATRAMRLLIPLARGERRHHLLVAFPKVENAPSNAVCRKVPFVWEGECVVEYPKGHPIRCNAWTIELWRAEEPLEGGRTVDGQS